MISKDYSNYNLAPIPKNLAYKEPENYITSYGRRKRKPTLAEGEVAPTFQLASMNGDSVSLEELKGKKVMLDFSIINCGYCMETMKHINQEDFELNKDVTWLYINPVDSKERMEKHMKNLPIPFPALINAKEVGEQYGIYGYPIFILIDEKGIIEKVQHGYSEEFINTYKL
ncbi:TlpA disulfide reductase family protein [Flammeovirgaceae bacterium SG7u.111]|nr:TlpA disulfide reductase family protein [Flammeovirgaceae bacterium SG7u.132]WPO37031.1 TlpA disulfide reductase family protein [Flammeovirgaceae bacterium SG7u.111]